MASPKSPTINASGSSTTSNEQTVQSDTSSMSSTESLIDINGMDVLVKGNEIHVHYIDDHPNLVFHNLSIVSFEKDGEEFVCAQQ
jgi:hypothetical protein